MTTKICTKCKAEKDISEFYKRTRSKDGLSCWCKQCTAKKNKKYHELHPWKSTEHERALARARYTRRTEEQKEKRKIQQREWQRKNKDKIAKYHKKYKDSHKKQIQEADKIYRKRNREKIKRAQLNRLHSDPKHKLKEQVRNMVRYAMKSKGHRKKSLTKDIVGCDLNFLCDYLFKTWEKNYGKPWDGEPYHIDHIVPLATAHTEEEVLKLNHYTNLQLLTPEDNMAKSDKLPS